MNINATLLIQAFNFFIAYWLLRSLLFKPTIRVIDNELANKASFIGLINQQKQHIALQKEEHERIWQICRQYCRAHGPDVEYQQVRALASQLELSTAVIASQEAQELVRTVSENLEERIKNVR